MAAKKAKAKTTAEKLDTIGIDAICERLLGGEYLTGIAAQNGMSVQSITSWIAANPERSARAREARVASAAHWDCQAERVLLLADEMVPGAITKARELASHYRWRASKYAPKDYGDKLDITAEVTVSSLTDDQLLDKAKTLADKLGLSVSGVCAKKGGV